MQPCTEYSKVRNHRIFYSPVLLLPSTGYAQEMKAGIRQTCSLANRQFGSSVNRYLGSLEDRNDKFVKD